MSKKHKQLAQAKVVPAIVAHVETHEAAYATEQDIAEAPMGIEALLASQAAELAKLADTAKLAKVAKERKQPVSEAIYRLVVPATSYTSDSKAGPCTYLYFPKEDGSIRQAYQYHKAAKRVGLLMGEDGITPLKDRKGVYPMVSFFDLPLSRIQAIGPEAVARSFPVPVEAPSEQDQEQVTA